MKRIICLILVFSILLSFFSVTGYATEDDPAVHALLSDYLNYLQRSEQNYTTMLWALSYTEECITKNDWDSILKARLAISTASTYISERNLVPEQMTAEHYNYFLEKNQDVMSVSLYISQYDSDKSDILNILSQLAYDLEGGVFFRSAQEEMGVKVRLSKRLCEINLEELGIFTDYLLAELEASDLTRRFSKVVTDNLPSISGYRNIINMTQAQIETYGTLLAEEREELWGKMGQLITLGEVRLSKLEEGGTKAYQADLNQPTGISVSLPYPTWEEENTTAKYYILDESRKIFNLKPGDYINRTPDVCILTYTGVKFADVLDYMLLLRKEYNVDVLKEELIEASFEAICSYQKKAYIITWEEGTATIYMPDGIVCLIF